MFCNQRKITGQETPVTAEQVSEIIEESLVKITGRRQVELAFYGGSFTALSLDCQYELLQPAYQALQRNLIHSIRISTRPDCINPVIVKNLAMLGVRTVELGVQSMDDAVLAGANRGHTAKDVSNATSLIKNAGLACGVQLMPGLPGENWSSLICTVTKIIGLRPDFARVYPTLVIAGTPLANLYYDNRYKPLTIPEAVAKSAYIKLTFEQQGIKVIRTGLQATAELSKAHVVLAGPYHPAFGELVDSFLFFLMAAHCIEILSYSACEGEMTIHHHPKDSSKLRGVSGENIRRLKKTYKLSSIILKPDHHTLGELVIDFHGLSISINKNMLNYI